MIRLSARIFTVAGLCGALLAFAARDGAARVSPSNPDRAAGAPARHAVPSRAHGALGLTDILNLRSGLEYATLQDAIDAASTLPGDTLVVQVPTHAESPVTVSKSVTIRGGAGGATLLPVAETGVSGDSKGWFVVLADGVIFRDLTFDASGFRVYQCLRIEGAGPNVVERCTFVHIGYEPSVMYAGFGVVDFLGGLTVRDCSFSDMGRVGVFLTGPVPSLVDHITYAGKGAGDWLDYGIEIGLGGVGTVRNSSIQGCLGVASVDNSGSAGVLATDYFGPGTSLILENCGLNGNSQGVAAGYVDGDHPVDATVVAAHGNDLSGNAGRAVGSSVNGTLDASGNWWGATSESGVAAQVSGNPVDYTPWLHSGTDTSPAPGFQGSFSYLHVSAVSPQAAGARIAEALGLAGAGTVDLAAGTYPEPLLLNTAGLVLRGAQYGVDACTRSGDESVIDGGAEPNGTVRVTADNVTLDGLKVVNSTYGVYGSATCAGLVVRNTVIDGATADGIIFYKASTGTAQHNRILNCGATGISGGDEDGHPTTALIEDNCLVNVRLGISGHHSGSTIQRNSVRDFAGAPPAAGISGQLENTLVTNNAVSGYLQAPGVALTAYPGRPSSHDVTLSRNLITGNAAGLYFDAAAPLVNVKATDNGVYANTPSGAVVNLSAATFDASGNWWGTAAEAGVSGQMSGAVDFTPWLHSPASTGSPGFHGDFSVLDVSAAGQQKGSVGRIQEAVGMVSGSTVNVLAGTYTDPVILNVPNLNLLGANAGVDGRGARGPESVISCSEAAGSFQVQADHVVIDGFQFPAGSAKAIHVNGAAPSADVTVRNNVVLGATVDGINLFHASSGTVLRNLVQDVALSGITAGNDMGTPNVADDVRTRATITYNKLVRCTYGIAGYQRGSTVADNELIGSGAGVCGICGQFDSVAVTANRVSAYTNPAAGYGIGFSAYPNRSNPSYDVLTGNTVSGNTVGMGFDPVSVTGMAVHLNDLTGNAVGLGSQAGVTLDATCNWWGDLLGPSVPPGNPSPANGVLGAVAYSPWLNGSIAGSPVCNQYGANYVQANSTGLCISSAHTCVGVPLEFVRADTGLARGISITFQLSSNLKLCVSPQSSIHQGLWLGGYPSSFQVIDNGGGSYTADQVILGDPCGVSLPGTPLAIDVARATGASDGTGTITVTEVTVRDCRNVTLPGIPGPVGTIRIDFTAPDSIGALAATQRRAGNAAGSVTRIDLGWTGLEAGTSVEVYRAGFGHYPEYDDAGGAVPARPTSYPPGSPWTLAGSIAGGATTFSDSVPTRDFWYYVACVKDGCGNVSRVSNRTLGTLNYHLGDVSNGSTPGVGNNRVYTEDISLLGSHYGITLALNDPWNYLDVGPASDMWVLGRPLTDNKLNFEDLIVFSMNYRLVSKPAVRAVPASRDRLTLETDGAAGAGAVTARLRFEGAGKVQGLSVRLAWDPAVVEPVGQAAGELLETQAGVAFSPAPGAVDAVLLGEDRALTGEGTLATLTFRRVGPGEPGIAIAAADARDTRNRPVQLDGAASALPVVAGLRPVAPNPFRGSATLEFALSAAGPAELAVFSVDGRLVRTLVSGVCSAGAHRVVWDGRDGQGTGVAPGVYYAHLRSAQGSFTRSVIFLK